MKSVSELCRKVTSGGTPSRARPEFFRNGTIPWIKTGELKDGIVTEYEERITAAAVQESAARVLPANTVLMAMYGATVGALGILSEPSACNQASCALIANEEVCDYRWLFYALLNDRPRAVGLATGAAQQNLSGRTIGAFSYLTPSLVEQRAIADVLDALDKKIAANVAIQKNLLRFARANWALKLAGNAQVPLRKVVAPGLSGVWGEADYSAKLSEKVHIFRGRDLQDYVAGTQLDLPERFVSLAQAGKRIASVTTEIWTAGSGSLGPSLLVTPEVRRGFDLPIMYSNFVRRLVALPGQERHLTSAWFAMLAAWDAGDFQSFRTGTAMPNLDVPALLSGVKVPLLREAERREVSKWAELATSLERMRENHALAALRDTLLPQLMSGKLRVRDAERAVSEVL